ncbi:MAG: tetratricopeptide repeat protein [Acidobacteria bacterium]|nr:tetratricopeptide repeat protein [Acidobacteriota bacterium]MBI3422880.1 tetratricopeptide repeat protein [Acidobacteriota bacterium]
MKEHAPWIIVSALVVLLGASSPASGEKELIIRLQGEVLVLQRQLRDLQESFDKAQGQSNASLQKLADSSEGSQRILAGIEESFKTTQTSQTNNLAGTNARLNKIIDQLTTNEQKFNQLGQQVQGLKSTVEQYQHRLDTVNEEQREREKKQADAVPTITGPEQLYSFAYNQFSQGKYDQAIANFRRYLNGYGQTEAADNALFWIAESLTAQGKIAEALREYERLLIDYPNSDRGASTTFKKGVLLLQLERREEGVGALRSVIARYPASPEASQATQELTRLGESLTPPAQPATKPNTRIRSGKPTP